MSENEFVNQYQAAAEIGLSSELLKHFTKHCRKYKDDHRLPRKKSARDAAEEG
ncbi:MAG: hypothetical protein P4L53_17575 [Candidatus Obscuribacterales bacterium]|nr:hypothetical protein [Candidatus Obscuribacterales bacterium]